MTLFLVVVFGVQEINGQTTFYSQGFESTNDWTFSQSTFSNNSNYWVWGLGTALATTGYATHSGTKSLQILQKETSGWNANYSNNASNQYDRSSSKTFNFSSIPCGSTVIFKYWILCNGETGFDDLTVSVNSNVIQGPFTGITTWQQKIIDLSSFVGNNNVVVSFNWRNNNSIRIQPAARIDDIEITYTPLLTNVNAGNDVTICTGGNTQITGSPTLVAISGSTTAQSNIMQEPNYVTDNSNTEMSVTILGAPANATITSITFTPQVWVDDWLDGFYSCYKYNNWVKMQYWNGTTWTDIINCNQSITISNFNGNLANGTIIKIRTVNIPGDTSDNVYTDLLNVVANYQYSNPLSYSWSPTTGLSSSTISNPIASPSTTTTYTMTATANGCSVSDDVIVTVLPIPTYGAIPSTVNHVVISQIYGGGGNSGAIYTNDFIELFNPTNAPISLNSYSLQYAATSGVNWDRVNLLGTIASGNYFLIQLASQPTPVGAALPTPDLSSNSINMANDSGKIALINNQNTITTGLSCPPLTSAIDFVGYGTANCSEGSSTALSLTSAFANFRNGLGGQDTDVNSFDFTKATPNPRNSSTLPQANQSFCVSGTPNLMVVNGSSGSGSFLYQWYSHSGLVAAPTGASTTGWTSLGTSNGGTTNIYTPTSAITVSTTYACFVTPSGTPTCGLGAWASGVRQITINPMITPTFTPIAAVCTGATLANLPTTSSNSISGTWSPALNNITTTTYTFFPNIGQCTSVTPTTLEITINPIPSTNPIYHE